MTEKALQYVQNQLAQAPFRLRSYIQDESRILPHRFNYKKMEDLLETFLSGTNRDERWIIMPGLRGVGKTTLIAQLYINILPKLDQRRMLFVSLDEVVNVVGESLATVLSAYEKILGSSFERQTDPFCLFIDEVHHDPKWAAVLKSIHDRTKKAFILCSGSSAMALQSNTDIIRRTSVQKLFPASFSEYLLIKNNVFPAKELKEQIKDALFFSRSTDEVTEKLKALETDVLQFWAKIDSLAVEDYMKKGTLPFAITINDDARVYRIVNLLIDKVINDDLQSISRFDSDTLRSIKKILFILADTTDQVSLKTLADLFQTSPNTLIGVLEALEKTELLIRVLPYGKNISRVKKPSKYLFMSSALRSSLLSVARDQTVFTERTGKFMEDIAALTFFRELVSTGLGEMTYDPADNSADFILTVERKNLIPVEIGMGTKGLDQVKTTMSRLTGSTYGLIISRSQLQNFKEDKIVKVPLNYFLLV